MPASQFVDHYAVLGVARDAGARQIDAAHRRIARVNAAGQLGRGDAAELTLKQANVSRSLLKNDRNRARFDRELARHEALTGAKPVETFTHARRVRPLARAQQIPRPAQRVFASIGLSGLARANQTTAAQAASAQGQAGRATAAKAMVFQLKPPGY